MSVPENFTWGRPKSGPVLRGEKGIYQTAAAKSFRRGGVPEGMQRLSKELAFC